MKFIVFLLLMISVPAQQPNPTHDDVMKALNELRREAAETKAVIKQIRATQLQRQTQREVQVRESQAEQQRQREARIAKKKQAEIENQKQKTLAAEARLNAAKAKLELARQEALIDQNIETRLAELDANPNKSKSVDEQRLIIAALVVERARIRAKIAKNNRTIRCRVFHVGCIK